MSEPYSAMAQFQISLAALKNYLAAAARPASSWPDWADMSGRYDATGRSDGLPFSLHRQPALDDVDRWLSQDDYRHQLRAILGVAEAPSLARFDYDEESGTATVANLTLAAESFRNPAWFLATVRGVAEHLDPAGGLAVVRNYLWEAPGSRYTLAVLQLEPGGSRFLHPADDAVIYADAVRLADDAFGSIGLGPDGPPPGDGGALANLHRV
jgi:hypothetical protein